MKIIEVNSKEKFSFSCIYLLTNLVNQKKYVGQAQNCYTRMRQYLRGNDKHRLIGKALLKYGIDNFDLTLLETNLSLENLDQMEQYWMDYYQSYNLDIGYNVCKEAGTTRGYHHTESDKAKMSEIALKRFAEHPEYRLSGEKSPHYGKHPSKETREKMSASRMGNQNAKGKTWVMSEETKTKISNALKGKQNCLGRKLSEETKAKIAESNRNRVISEDSRKKMSESHKGKTTKKVMCVETGKVFNSITDASIFIGRDGSAISACCRGKQKTCGGYHWEYVNE